VRKAAAAEKQVFDALIVHRINIDLDRGKVAPALIRYFTHFGLAQGREL
jgi:hypothetical protein